MLVYDGGEPALDRESERAIAAALGQLLVRALPYRP